jgi:hypothetical protein
MVDSPLFVAAELLRTPPFCGHVTFNEVCEPFASVVETTSANSPAPSSQTTIVSSFGGACVLGANFDLARLSFQVPTLGSAAQTKPANPKTASKSIALRIGIPSC